MRDYYDEFENEYTDSSSGEEDSNNNELSQEEWEDWNSEELLNLWMSIVEYHEEWYLPLKKTFNQFCDFAYQEKVQVIKDLDVNKFFSCT